MGSALAWSTPGVTSTIARRRTSSGCCAARQMAVSPPSDIPTTRSAAGASSRTTVATSSARWAGQYEWSSRQSEWPWPGRSTQSSGRSSARATVSQVWAFWAPPWMRTISGGPVPHRRALSRRSPSTGTETRSTVGGPSSVSPTSSAFSANSPNSSYWASPLTA